MSRPFLLLLLIAGLFTGLVGGCWLHQPPSNQELLANYAKAQDYANAAAAMHGFAWWTPNYLQGVSLSYLSIGAATNLSLYLAGLLFGYLIGPKLAALLFLFLCPLTMYGFVRRLCPADRWIAFACALAYLFTPPILLRLGHVEHVGNILAFALLPASFWSVLSFLERRHLLAALQCAVVNALLVLAYAKIAVLTLPLLAAFAVWAWISRANFSLPSRGAVLLCLGAFFVLAVLPNLPSMREMGMAAKFDFGPFAGWQKNYSEKTVLSLLDRDSVLTGSPTSPQSEVRTPSSYVGIAQFLGFASLLLLRKRPVWLSAESTVFRLFVALALLANWLAFGAYNPLLGQWTFLATAYDASDPAIALSWLLLAAQAMVIYLILPGSLPSRRWWAVGVIAIYFIVPGFRIVEKFPFYSGIRSPHDFFEMGGTFCFCVAAGIGTVLTLRQMPSPTLRIAPAVLLGALAAMDGVSAVPSFFRSPMDRATFDDFLAAQEYLKKSSSPGKVYPFSGRYFYILTPLLSGRPIVTEAFNGHLMMRGVAALQQASGSSREDLLAFLKISGISYVLIDKQDPDTPEELQNVLRSLLPTSYENEHFAILEDKNSLSPAAFAKDFYILGADEKDVPQKSLLAIRREIIPVRIASGFEDRDGEVHDLSRPLESASLDAIPSRSLRRPNPQEIAIDPPPGKGWLLIPESSHPDWRASQNGKEMEIGQVGDAYLGLRLSGKPGEIRLTFVPPAWYSLSLGASLAGWLVCGLLLSAHRFRLLPAAMQARLSESPLVTKPILPATGGPGPTIQKFLVIIPTYNEATGILATLDRTLAADPRLEILVVDDGSPDGTAQHIRRHPAFGARLHLLEREGKLGLGSAYRQAFQWAIERGYDACVEMDADLSHNPADIPALIHGLDTGADAAIGSRYLGGVRVLNWPQDRLFLSLGASKFVRAVTKLPLTDATSGFKALRTEALRKLDWRQFKAEGYGFQIELHFFLWKQGARIVEVPIVFTERSEGKTKMTSKIALEAWWRVLNLGLIGK